MFTMPRDWAHYPWAEFAGSCMPNLVYDTDVMLNDVDDPIVKRYGSLVRDIALKLAVKCPPSVELSVLVNDGYVGLLDALPKFDPSRGVKLETFVYYRIQGAMLDGLRKLDWVPRSVRERQRAIAAVKERLEHELGRAPDVGEIADVLGVSERECRGHLSECASRCVMSLESELFRSSEDSGPSIADSVASRDASVLSLVESRMMIAGLPAAFNLLSALEQRVVVLYYYDGLTFEEIADLTGYSQSWISMKHASAISRMRASLDPRGESDPTDLRDRVGRQRFNRRSRPAARFKSRRMGTSITKVA